MTSPIHIISTAAALSAIAVGAGMIIGILMLAVAMVE
jgi:hypothetical protein